METEGSDFKSNAAKQTSNKLESFSMVNFCNVPESFTAASDVECSYRISEQLEASTHDWVGLYKVGWRSSKDYVYYMWSPLPLNYTAGKEAFSHVTFPGSKVPKDDGEFYQFCYVNSSGHIRGASAPFQFRQPANEDFIEIEDENGELLVIRTKTAVLEDQLKKANKLHADLLQKIKSLESEKATLVLSEKDFEGKYYRQKDESEALQTQLRETSEKLTDMLQEAKDLQVHERSLQDKVEVLNQEKQSIEKRLDDNDSYIASLQEKIKTLVTDKDSLIGRTKILEEEKEQLQAQISTSDGRLQHYINECERLATRLREADSTESMLNKDLERVKAEVIELQAKYAKYLASSHADKESITDLQENLRNAEDKLEAAESCKKMLNDEVLTVKQSFEKMSFNLEVAKQDADVHRNLVSQLLKEKTKKQEELEDLTNVLNRKLRECEAQSEVLAELRHQVTIGCDGSASYALESAMKVLKKRFTELQRKYDELDRTHQQTLSVMKQLKDNELKHEEDVESLKGRLVMGVEEYKKIFIERDKLKNELDKLKSTGEKSKMASSCDLASGLETDLLRQMSEIQTQLDKRGEKAVRYKRMYTDLKKKYEAATNQHKQELQCRQSPVIDVPQKNRTMPLTPVKSPPKVFPAKQMEESFDPLLASGHERHLTPPLKPLPPPIQPQILPSAKVAAVKAQSGLFGSSSTDEEMVDPVDDVAINVNRYVVDPLPVYCSYCHDHFTSLCQLNEHVMVAHDFYICPMCSAKFPNANLAEFETHVNNHFD